MVPEPSSPGWLAAAAAVVLLSAALVGMLARRLGVPYAVALVIGGLVIEAAHVTPVPQLEPDLLLGFLPPLLFERRSAWTSARHACCCVRSSSSPCQAPSLLPFWSAPASHSFSDFLPVALVFGSVVAATDPVPVVDVFKHLHAPGRIAAIAEGESLINNGVAITIYTAVLVSNQTCQSGWATIGRGS